MEYKDYYAALGVKRGAAQDEIKRAYRKLARKYHPDVSKEADAEARFKDVAEAYAALGDPEKRAAYDAIGTRQAAGAEFRPPPGWNSGFEFSGRDAGEGGIGGGDFDASEFFEALFGRQAAGARGPRSHGQAAGGDHHARVQIDLKDAYQGARRTITLRMPEVDGQGQVALRERALEVNIPRGIRDGQHLRLAGQGGAGHGGGPAGDLYLEIEIVPPANFRVDGRDVFVDLPLAPWEAALGATVTMPTPDASVQLAVPAGSTAGRKLRLKGKGIPGAAPGDLYAVLQIALPPADGDAARQAYRSFAASFGGFDPRREREG